MSGFTWKPEEYYSLPSPFQKARTLLEKWFQAMGDGTVEQWFPDPLSRAQVSQEQASRIMERMDEEFDKELAWAKSPEAGSYTAGPGFSRLKPPQQIALVQQLSAILGDMQNLPPTDTVKESEEWRNRLMPGMLRRPRSR